MQLIDTHCHIDVEEFDADRAAVIARAKSNGVHQFVIPGIYRDQWPRLLAMCAADIQLRPALGLHPVYLEKHRPDDTKNLAAWVERELPIAIGEIGLDYAIKALDRDRQLRLFEDQLEVAKAFDLPVLLHVRKAHDEVLYALRKQQISAGICHAFNGSLQQAENYIDLGFKLGFGGMLTYQRSRKLRSLAAKLPLNAIVLETDAPDLTVASHQYQRNSPEYLPEVLSALSEVRHEELEAIAAATTANAVEILNLRPVQPDSKQRDPSLAGG